MTGSIKDGCHETANIDNFVNSYDRIVLLVSNSGFKGQGIHVCIFRIISKFYYFKIINFFP